MKVLKKLSVYILAGLCCLGIGAAVQAAEKVGNGVYQLQTNVFDEKFVADSYSKADITNDGKADKIETECTPDEIDLKVNGQIVRSWLAGQVNVSVVELSKKAFLEITTYENNNKVTCGLYQIKKNKLTRVFDYKKLVNLKQYVSNDFTTYAYYDTFEVMKTKGDTVYLKGRMGTKSLGQIYANGLQLVFDGKTFALKTSAAPAEVTAISYSKGFSKTFISAQKIQAYKAAASSKKAFTIAKKTKFNIQKLAVVKKNIYVQIKTSTGKTGWIQLTTSDKKLVTSGGVSMGG